MQQAQQTVDRCSAALQAHRVSVVATPLEPPPLAPLCAAPTRSVPVAVPTTTTFIPQTTIIPQTTVIPQVEKVIYANPIEKVLPNTVANLPTEKISLDVVPPSRVSRRYLGTTLADSPLILDESISNSGISRSSTNVLDGGSRIIGRNSLVGGGRLVGRPIIGGC